MDHSHSTIGNVPGISGTVVKKSNKDLGISFLDHPSEDVVYIHKVKGTFRKHTMLASGLRVTHVNGLIVFTAAEAMKLIRKTQIGASVQVIAAGKYIETKKPKRSIFRSSSTASSDSGSSSTPLGIHLRSLPGRLGLVQITKVDNLLSEVPIGHILVSINKKPIRSVKKAHWYIRTSSSSRVKLVTTSVHSFSCVSPGGVVEAAVSPIMDHDSVNAFHPDMQEEEEDPFFAPLSAAWTPSLEQQLDQLDSTEFAERQRQQQQKSSSQDVETDTILNQYEEDSILREYRVQRQNTGDSNHSSLLLRNHSHDNDDAAPPKRSSDILETIATDENGDYVFEDDPIIRLPSSLQQSVRSLSTMNTNLGSTVSSAAASGLPDMIMNLQTQNDLMDEAMGSFLSGQPGENAMQANDHDDNMNAKGSAASIPFIFVDSASDSDDEENKEAEDLTAFLTMEGHLQQQQQPQKFPSAAALAMADAAARQKNENMMSQTPLRDSTNNKSSPYSPCFFDNKRHTSALFQSVEKAKRSGENQKPSKLNRRKIPAFLDHDLALTESTPQEKLATKQTSSSFRRANKLVDDKICLPAQIHINAMDGDLQSFLTEEEEVEKVDYFMEKVIDAPMYRTPPKSPKKEKFPFALPTSLPSPFKNKQNNREHQQSWWKLQSCEQSVEEEEEEMPDTDDDSVVGEMEADEHFLVKGLHFLQAIAADATACVSPSGRYYQNMKNNTRQYEVYAV